MRTKNKVALLSLIVVAACSSKEPAKKPVIYPNESPEVSTTNPKETSIVAKQVAAEQGSNFVAEISFKKGSAELTKQAQQDIRSSFEKAAKTGKLEGAQVITWADKEYPSEEKGKLADAQQKLVEKRNDRIKKFVQTLEKDLDVKKISMAERASTWGKFSSTKEAEVKEALSKKDAPAKSGEAMVIFMPKK